MQLTTECVCLLQQTSHGLAWSGDTGKLMELTQEDDFQVTDRKTAGIRLWVRERGRRVCMWVLCGERLGMWM